MIHRLTLVVLLAVSGLIGSGQLTEGQGASLYPICRRCRHPISSSTESAAIPDLRFSNTVWNAGEGRLEIQGNPKPPKKKEQTIVRQIFQNIYDAPTAPV